MSTAGTTSLRVCCLLAALLTALTGCLAQQPRRTAPVTTQVGPAPSTAVETQAAATATPAASVRLDVIIPVFDPGLSEEEQNYEEQGVWPELRRAEANRFAWKLKQAMENTRVFGAVRVTPDASASGELYVLGRILESNGEEVNIELEVIDASGRSWMKDSFGHQVPEHFHKSYRNRDKDAYDPVFDTAANRIATLLRARSHSERQTLKSISTLQFGSHLNAAAFSGHTRQENGITRLLSLPSANDPMLQRVNAVRVREQLFVDGMQNHYTTFSSQMEESYLKWQEASQLERQALRKAKKSKLAKMLGGALLVGLAVAAGVSSAGKDTSPQARAALQSGAALGGLAGAWMLSESFKSREEAKLHKAALDEMGESIDLEFAPQVVELEEQSAKLQGNAREQFAQWRTFLKRIYAQEQTPDVQL